MIYQIGIVEAKAKLEELVAAVEAGHRVIITRWGLPVVEIVPYVAEQASLSPTQPA